MRLDSTYKATPTVAAPLVMPPSPQAAIAIRSATPACCASMASASAQATITVPLAPPGCTRSAALVTASALAASSAPTPHPSAIRETASVQRALRMQKIPTAYRSAFRNPARCVLRIFAVSFLVG